MLKAGQLNKRITLETLTAGRDEYGGQTEEWGTPQQVWAEIRFPSAREIFQGDQLTAVQSAVFKIRYRAGVSAAKNRVKYNGQVYNIAAVTEIGNREGLQLIGEAENNG